MATGSVKSFNDEEAWGVLTSAEVPGDVWFHHSSLDVQGYHAVQAGQAVDFEWEHIPAGQDGYYYRSSRVRPI